MNSAVLPRITVSENHRFLTTETGAPFFWLADTAWELFHRLTREETEVYFATRARQGFNVIQAVALAEFDGLNQPNRYGDYPLVDNDPTQPNEAYFRLVDEYCQRAAAHGLYIGLLPTWGDKLTHLWGTGPVVFTADNAYAYGLWMGQRYRLQTNILWVMGGDRPVTYQDAQGAAHDDTLFWREMARGIREGVGDFPLLMTFHPNGGVSSSEWIHHEAWLDMNMMQSGHGGGHDVPVWQMIAADAALLPAKPTLDGEPNYEDHPVNPWPSWNPENGYYRDDDVRKQCYRSVFAGGCGVTYGHHAVWQFFENWRTPINYPDREWRNAILRPGAEQIGYLRQLMESRAFFSRISDQSIVVSAIGEGGEHIQATRDAQGAYLMVYLPTARPVSVHLSDLHCEQALAQWFDPRTGAYQAIGTVSTRQTQTFTPPSGGPDWVLVVECQ